MRKVFLDDLPRYKCGKSSLINWKNSVGYTISFVYDEIDGKFEILDYRCINSKKPEVLVRYNENISWIQVRQLHTGEISKFIGAKRVIKRNLMRKYDVGDRLVDEYNDVVIVAKDNGKGYQYYCNICGYDSRCGYYTENGEWKSEQWVRSASHRGVKKFCSCCSSRIIVPGINDIATQRPDLIKYFPGETFEEKRKNAERFTPYSSRKTDVECPDCGRIHKNVIVSNIEKGHFGCICNDGKSYPEKFFISLLEQLGVKYKYQQTFQWGAFYNPYKKRIVNIRYDFYLIDENIIVETDGAYGHGFYAPTADEDIFIDKQKDILASNNDIEIIRIDCRESTMEYLTSSIINSRFATLFDLSNIDFAKCNLEANNNISKDVVNDYMLNLDLTASDLARKYNISITTVLRYIKMHGYEYDKTRSSRKKKNHNIRNSKAISVLHPNNPKTYDSVHIFAEKSMDDYGIIVNPQSLSNAIRKNREYKGLKIVYLT